MKNRYTLPLLGVVAMFLAGCGETENNDTAAAVDNTQVSALMAAEKPADAKPLGEVVATAKPGEKVVVSGQIGGHIQPFGSDYASLILADTSIVFCNEMGDDDHCVTPWDACCEDPEKMKNNRAMVQFVDAQGTPLPFSLKDQGGLQELDNVIISGVIAESSTPANLVINGQQIYKATP